MIGFGSTTRRVGVLCLVGAGLVLAQEFDLSRHTIDGGGVMRSTGGAFELSGTIGQPDAGAMTGGAFSLTGGFWFPLIAGDADEDGGVTLFDLELLTACMTGEAAGPPTAPCISFDEDRDNDVDLRDAGNFQRVFSGS